MIILKMQLKSLFRQLMLDPEVSTNTLHKTKLYLNYSVLKTIFIYKT